MMKNLVLLLVCVFSVPSLLASDGKPKNPFTEQKGTAEIGYGDGIIGVIPPTNPPANPPATPPGPAPASNQNPPVANTPVLTDQYVATVETTLRKEIKPLADALATQSKSLDALVATLKENNTEQMKLLREIAGQKKEEPKTPPQSSGVSQQNSTGTGGLAIPSSPGQVQTQTNHPDTGKVFGMCQDGTLYQVQVINGKETNVSGMPAPGPFVRRFIVLADGSLQETYLKMPKTRSVPVQTCNSPGGCG